MKDVGSGYTIDGRGRIQNQTRVLGMLVSRFVLR